MSGRGGIRKIYCHYRAHLRTDWAIVEIWILKLWPVIVRKLILKLQQAVLVLSFQSVAAYIGGARINTFLSFPDACQNVPVRHLHLVALHRHGRRLAITASSTVAGGIS